MFCPSCGTWNRTRAVKCLRCKGELPELRDTPCEPPDPEISLIRKATGGGTASSGDWEAAEWRTCTTRCTPSSSDRWW